MQIAEPQQHGVCARKFGEGVGGGGGGGGGLGQRWTDIIVVIFWHYYLQV